MSQAINNSTRSWALAIGRPSRRTICLCILAIGLLAVARRLAAPADAVPAWATLDTVRPAVGDFVRTVHADGEVETYKPAMVYSQVRAHSRRIIDMVPHGSWVEKGDVVVVLDASEFKDQLKRPLLGVLKETGRLGRAEQSEITHRLDNEGRIERRALDVLRAQGSLREYSLGDYNLRRARLLGTVKRREQELEQAIDEMRYTELLTLQGIVSTAGLKATERRVQQATIELDLARGEVRLLDEFQHPRTMVRMEFQAEETQHELERTQLRNGLEASMARFNTLTARKSRSGWQDYVDYLQHSIEHSIIRAPRAGLVVYAHRATENKFIAVGERVHYQQKLFTIADRSTMTIAGRVSDRDFFSLRRGQPANVRLPSLPGRIFPATLGWLGPIPTQTSRFAPESRHHKIEILLDESGPALADVFPGMTAEAEIIVDSREDVLLVPIDAAVQHRGEYVALIRSPGGIRRRVFEAGSTDDSFIEVLAGLSEDDLVLTGPAETLRGIAESVAGD